MTLEIMTWTPTVTFNGKTTHQKQHKKRTLSGISQWMVTVRMKRTLFIEPPLWGVPTIVVKHFIKLSTTIFLGASQTAKKNYGVILDDQ
jgi:hypothetical protein